MKGRRYFKALLVIAIAAGLIGFTKGKINAGYIYCFANTEVSHVYQSLSCTATGQPQSTKIDFRPTANQSDPTTNPCLSNETPFDGSSACTQLYPGTNHFVATAQ